MSLAVKEWEKRYIGSALRWGLFALCGIMIGTETLIAALVPYDEILKYRDGVFYYYYPRNEYYACISVIIFAAAALIFLFSVVWELFTKQRISDKISRIAITVFLGFIFYVSFVISGIMIYGYELVRDPVPYGAEEYRIDGYLLVLCSSPYGLHHDFPALYEVAGDDVYYLGSGKMYQGRADDFKVTQTENGYIVTYTETINGEEMKNSFTAERNENLP